VFRDAFLDKLLGMDTRPNKFTIEMGKLIRQAREDAGLSQRDLADKIYRRQAALSEMENGKMEPDASTLLLLSHILLKPISYFYPDFWKSNLTNQNLTDQENELLLLLKKMMPEDQKRILVQIKALVISTERSG
jgi:transcriptional regulator with XRE-family HTH domain